MDFSLIWEKVQALIKGAIVSLPNIALALIISAIFYVVARGINHPQQILFHDQSEATDSDRARQREGWPAGTAAAPQPRSIAAAITAARRNRRIANGEDLREDRRL